MTCSPKTKQDLFPRIDRSIGPHSGGASSSVTRSVSIAQSTRRPPWRVLGRTILSPQCHQADVCTQFLIEAVSLRSVGGLIGIIFGIGASKLLSIYAHWPTLISIGSIALSFFVSAGVGVFFGFYPACEAARLDPIEALRYE